MDISTEKIMISHFVLFLILRLATIDTIVAQNPALPPSGNFDLPDWKITLPDQTVIKEAELNNGFEKAE